MKFLFARTTTLVLISMLVVLALLISETQNYFFKNNKHRRTKNFPKPKSNEVRDLPLVQLEYYPHNSEIVLGENKSWTVAWSATTTAVAHNSRIETYLYGQKNSLKNVFSSLNIKNRNFIGKGDLKLPKEAGVYIIKFIQDNNKHTIASTGPIILNPADVSLFVFKLENQPGEVTSVAWQISEEMFEASVNSYSYKSAKGAKEEKASNSTSFFKDRDKDKSKAYLCLNIIGAYDDCFWSKEINSLKGIEKVKMADFAGYFVFRIIIKHNTWKIQPVIDSLAVSKIIKVSNSSYALITPDLTSVVASTVKVEWSIDQDEQTGLNHNANSHLNDWIGLYSLESTEVFRKTDSPLRSIQTKGKLKGEFEAFIPANSDAGPFVFIYFANHIPISISAIINIQQPISGCPRNKETKSKIKHLVILCTENHSFDNYFGNYCKSAVNSNPECTEGANCCEKAPDEVDGFKPFILNDKQNLKFDPNHNTACELCEVNGGKMDGFVKGCYCSDPRNFAVADDATVKTVHRLAKKFALADRYFQPTVGASSKNNMYFARASYVFKDNTRIGIGSVGSNCWYHRHFHSDEYVLLYDPTITSLLARCDFTLKTYAEGYRIALNNFSQNPCYPRGFDSSDIPFQYYAGMIDKRSYITDYANFNNDVDHKSLPEVSFIKPLGINTGHPGKATIAREMKFIEDVVSKILKSDYAEDTLILWVPDESGGYYDHVPVPETNEVDGSPYGPRVPLLAIGKFAKKNYVSHVEMEHSSIVKFIEWNWLNGKTGQLNTRDRNVNNIGDLIDAEKAGIEVPRY